MKKLLFPSLAAAAVLVSCQEAELENTVPAAGETFRIEAPISNTKTVYTPPKQVEWATGDALRVIVNSSSPYEFTKSGDGDYFECSDFAPEAGVEYTYDAIYPYYTSNTGEGLDADGYTESYIPIPVAHNAAQVQSSANSTDHVKGPLYGHASASGTQSPVIGMHHLTALFKITVRNPSDAPIHLQTIVMSTDADGACLSGTFRVNTKTGELRPSGESYVSSTATLTITDGTVPAGESADFWISTPGFTVPSGNSLTITLTAEEGQVVSKKEPSSSGWDFKAGTVNDTEVIFDKAEAVEYLTVTEALSASGDVNVEGVVMAKNARSYILADETSYVLAYKNASPDEVKVGDRIRITGKMSLYNKMPQIESPIFVSTVSSSEVSYPEPELLDAAGADALVANPEQKYIRFTGMLSISGTYYNVDIDGASSVGSISFPADDLSGYNGKAVTLTGYFNGVSGSKYLNILYTEIAEAPYCEVSRNSVSVRADETSVTFDVNANVAWSISSDNTDFKVSPSSDSGNGNVTVTVSFPVNESSSEVKATLTVSSELGEHTVTITQLAAGTAGEPSELFISEYVEGSSSNKYLEIYNPTDAEIDLSPYSVELYANGANKATNTTDLTGLIAPGATIVLRHEKATIYNGEAIESTAMNFNGDDAIVLTKDGVVIDTYGTVGNTGDYGKDVTKRRNPDVSAPSTVFIESEWTTYDKDDVSDLGRHTMN